MRPSLSTLLAACVLLAPCSPLLAQGTILFDNPGFHYHSETSRYGTWAWTTNNEFANNIYGWHFEGTGTKPVPNQVQAPGRIAMRYSREWAQRCPDDYVNGGTEKTNISRCEVKLPTRFDIFPSSSDYARTATWRIRFTSEQGVTSLTPWKVHINQMWNVMPPIPGNPKANGATHFLDVRSGSGRGLEYGFCSVDPIRNTTEDYSFYSKPLPVDLYDGNFHVIDVYRSMSTSINTSAIAVRVDGHLVEWNDGIHRYAGGTKQLTNIGFVIDGASNGQFRTRVNGADYHIRFGAYGWLHPNVYPKGISTLDLDYVTIRTANLFDPNRPIVWP